MSFADYERQEIKLRNYFHLQYELQGEPIIHPDPDAPRGDQQIVLDKGRFECRYCGSTRAGGTKFKKAHVIPEQMGNKLIVSDAECTPCNETFSTYETDLGELLGPLKAILGVEGKSKRGRRVPKFNDPKVGTAITRSDSGVMWQMDPSRTTVRLDSPRDISIETRHLPYVPLLAWKGLARSAVHMLDLDELDRFEWFREAVHTEAHDKALSRSAGITCVISTFLPSMHNLFPRPELRLFKRRADALYAVEGSIQPEKMYVVKAASHVCQVPVFSDDDIQAMYQSTASGDALAVRRGIPIYPVLVPEDFVSRFDFPKRSMLNLNSTEKESPIDWIQIRHTGTQPLTDDQMAEAGLTADEIAQIKGDGLTGEAALKWLASLAPPPDTAT